MTGIPKISVCVPTRNRAATLRQTIEAVRAQSCPDWELIVGDDASTDDTPEVVASLRDSRIRAFRHERNLGIYGNWNYLIPQARGEYVCIYHDHDRYLPTILARCAAVLDANPRVAFVHTALVMVDEAGGTVGADVRSFPLVMPGTAMRHLLANSWHSPVMAATAMVRRRAYERAGAFDPARYGLGCDKAMWFRLAEGGDVGYIREPQALITARPKSAPTAQFNWETEIGLIRMRREQLRACYGSASPERAVAFGRFALQRNVRLLRLVCRAALLEPATVTQAGLDLMQAECHWPGRVLAQAACRHRFVRTALRHTLLARHYRRTAARAARDRQLAQSTGPFVRDV
jgi:GT2 family glycosyltransferase